MPYKSKKNKRKAWRVWYRKNQKIQYVRIKDNLEKRKVKIRQWLEAYKNTLKCSRCPESHIACLDFHHKNPEVKSFAIADVINLGLSIASIKREIEKCLVLCSNCHRKEHFQQGVAQPD